jgi:hypothetical protein
MPGIWHHWEVVVLSPNDQSSHFFESSVPGSGPIVDVSGDRSALKTTPLTLSSNDTADFVVLSVQLNEVVAVRRLSSLGSIIQDSQTSGSLKFIFLLSHSSSTSELPTPQRSSTLLCLVPNPAARQGLCDWFNQCTGLVWDFEPTFPASPLSIPEALSAVVESQPNAPQAKESKEIPVLDGSETAEGEWVDPADGQETNGGNQLNGRDAPTSGDDDAVDAPTGAYGHEWKSKRPICRTRPRGGKSTQQANIYGLKSTPLRNSYGTSREQENVPEDQSLGLRIPPTNSNINARHQENTAPFQNKGAMRMSTRKVKPTNIYSHLTVARLGGDQPSVPQQRPKNVHSSMAAELQKTFPDARPNPIQRRPRKPMGVVSGDIYQYTRVCRLFYGYDLDTISIMTLKVSNSLCDLFTWEKLRRP